MRHTHGIINNQPIPGISSDMAYRIYNRWGTLVSSGTGHNTPTEEVIDDIIKELAEGGMLNPIARLYLVDDQGTYRDYADITSDMWTESAVDYGWKISVTVTITVTTAYNLKKYVLVDTSLSKQYFIHELAGSIAVSAGYTVQITWEIIIRGDGTNITDVGLALIQKLEGKNTSPAKIASVEAWYDGQQVATTTDITVTGDTTNNKVLVNGTITFVSSQAIDTLVLKDGVGNTLIRMYIGERVVEADTPYPLNIEIAVSSA